MAQIGGQALDVVPAMADPRQPARCDLDNPVARVVAHRPIGPRRPRGSIESRSLATEGISNSFGAQRPRTGRHDGRICTDRVGRNFSSPAEKVSPFRSNRCCKKPYSGCTGNAISLAIYALNQMLFAPPVRSIWARSLIRLRTQSSPGYALAARAPALLWSAPSSHPREPVFPERRCVAGKENTDRTRPCRKIGPKPYFNCKKRFQQRPPAHQRACRPFRIAAAASLADIRRRRVVA